MAFVTATGRLREEEFVSDHTSGRYSLLQSVMAVKSRDNSVGSAGGMLSAVQEAERRQEVGLGCKI